ncbi:hypothetical protein B7P43_G10550 [Cryptotermes secundus]|uniref:Uncharacterized protein n=1 Tax=Cryptotermes secundus TaxID=105785 RepID=A0A2J7PRY7_9NEOP|nr:hypothetical protein B7P43_G10550 [Cryptotermes secundus]
MQELHTTVEHIKTKEGEVTHAIQKQLTYLKSIDEAISENAMGLATVTRVLKSVITNALTYQKSVEDEIQNLKTLINFQANVSRVMRELEFTVMQLQQSVIQLQEGLEISAVGRLSSVLIPPHNLSKILQEVALRLPQDVSLIAGFTVENMYVYYEVATVQAYATATTIRLIVRIPLRGADRVMTVFKSVPLPTYSDVLGRHIQIEPEAPYLAVTENRQYYSPLATADLQQCRKGSVTICEATFPFIHKNQATCVSALYFGQTDFAHKIPHLPELMLPEERRQITHDELRTRRALAALETVARQSSHVNQQPYVELRDLLDTVSTDGAMTSQVTWLYMLFAFSIVLPFVVNTGDVL